MDEKLIFALVAAASAVFGILLTQAFTLIRELIISRRENKTLLRDKYKLLADSLSESISHKTKVDNYDSEDIFSDYINQPIEKIITLSLRYLPGLIKISRCYYN